MSQLMITARLLYRQGLYGLMAILGLTVGLTVALFAMIYAWQETHYDSHIPNAERLHLVDVRIAWPDRAVRVLATTPGALASAVKAANPDIEAAVRVWRQYSTINLPDAEDFSDIIAAADPAFADLVDLQMMSGDRSLIRDPSQVLLSTTMAERVFGHRDAVGQTVRIDEQDMTVAGIFKPWPTTSHISFDVLMNGQAALVRGRETVDSDWTSTRPTFTYLLLREGADATMLARRVEEIFLARYQTREPVPGGKPLDDVVDISLQAVADLHLNGKNYPWLNPPADTLKLAVFTAISVLIVAIACINHINMSTARSIERAREVAVRKLMGAERRHLVLQFLLEAALLAGGAFLLALVAVEVLADRAGTLLLTDLDLSVMAEPGFIAWTSALMTAVVLAAGAYPAWLASAYRPGRILSVHGQGRSRHSRMRTVLVVFQFSVSIVLATGAAVIWNQLIYARGADLGFEADNVILLYGVRRSPAFTIELTSRIDRAISGRPGIVSVSGTHSSPSWDYVAEADIRRATEAPEDRFTIGQVSVDLDFFDTLGIEPVAGRVFSEAYGADRGQWDLETRDTLNLPVVINERAARALGFQNSAAAVGEMLQFTVSSNYDRAAEIVGVVPDVHFESFKKIIQPMVYFPDPASFNLMMVRIDPTMREEAMQSIRNGWAEVLAGQAISSDFLSTALIEGYEAEAQELRTVTVLAILGIVIATFGQYGLAAYSAQSRRREISIRKVLGARVGDIVALFIWQFSKPVFAAMLVAWPVAFVATRLWLETFAYRVAINPLWFILAGLAALTVALATMAGHALKAARTHPVEALRYE
ncbi:ABC transporter permease [Eilatimonas milleporae]|uniref:Putative ABC transport system permease protein n=1 Tax=Eilatimonas milleporae TaxID=911205 RepID=A0A3M0CVK4_9PROT|nr:ABC transporter permease [Eilatimonas milleporae]RMB07643.1 putative ABC transport system permease protein [Eilatimonas milleporae]